MIPHTNVDQISIHENQFVFTTIVPSGEAEEGLLKNNDETLLWHGVVQETENNRQGLN